MIWPITLLRASTLPSALCIALIYAMLSSAAMGRVVHEAEYQAKYRGMNITMKRQLVALGDGRFRLQARAKNVLGAIEEYEEFFWNDKGDIIPQIYRYEQRLFGSKRERSIDFDWQQKHAVTVEKDKERQLPLREGTLGPMSYQLQLQLDVAQGNENLEYVFIDRRRVKHYVFSTRGVERLQHKHHAVANALLLQRKDEDKNRAINIWLDADDHYTLASLQQIKEQQTQQMFLISSRFYPPFTDTPYSVFEEAATTGLDQGRGEANASRR